MNGITNFLDIRQRKRSNATDDHLTKYSTKTVFRSQKRTLVQAKIKVIDKQHFLSLRAMTTFSFTNRYPFTAEPTTPGPIFKLKKEVVTEDQYVNDEIVQSSNTKSTLQAVWQVEDGQLVRHWLAE
ncbi:hypothetical protein [[Leptolyngbya] sp. PCC 7376]|uniref:hypothetical protein n=1 Tax=[Leptolyngbya] sp. PCC 7376 TaxID=111781 RepID=UPI00059FAAAB|nr:hypothetical protein [[Leptolyngbya] sp. PCC 7376]